VEQEAPVQAEKPEENKESIIVEEPAIIEEIKEEPKVDTTPIIEDLTNPVHVDKIEDIPDWEDRMTRANYTAAQRDVINKCIEKKKEWMDIALNDAGWVSQVDDKKDGLKIDKRDSERGFG